MKCLVLYYSLYLICDDITRHIRNFSIFLPFFFFICFIRMIVKQYHSCWVVLVSLVRIYSFCFLFFVNRQRANCAKANLSYIRYVCGYAGCTCIFVALWIEQGNQLERGASTIPFTCVAKRRNMNRIEKDRIR